MRNYGAYAPIYARIGQAAWSAHMARWALGWLREHDVQPDRVTDWGCGEGTVARMFAAAGWQVTAVDRSPAMLALARQGDRSPAITWHEGDLRDARVPAGTVATALYDTLNYLTTLDDLRAAWRSISAALRAGGYAIVDVNTPYEYETNWNGQHVITADTDDALVLNRLRFNRATRIATGRIVWFARNATTDVWQRGAETHLQRAHSDAELCDAIAAAGLTVIERHTPQHVPVSETATRIMYIAQKH